MDACMSNRSLVTAGFVKTIVCAPLKKKKERKKKMNENTNLFAIIILTFEAVHLIFSFSKCHPFVAKHASILSIYFFNVSLKHSFGMCPKIIWVSWIIWASASKFQPCNLCFNNGNSQKSHGMRSRLYGRSFITSMLWFWHSLLLYKGCYVAEHCLDEEYTMEKVLVISTGYDVVQTLSQISLCSLENGQDLFVVNGWPKHYA